YSMFQLLMDVETLLLTPTTPHLRIWTAKLYPQTLFFSFSPNLHYLSLWDAAVVSSPDPPVETLCKLHSPPPHCRTLTLPHTLVSCIDHRMSVYILCTSTKYRLCITPVVSHPLLPHNAPTSPLPISTWPTSSRWVPPYVPWFCLRFLPD